MPTPSMHLHGWGYEGRTVGDLVTFARSVGSTLVVDIRLNPLSRRSGFSKRSLEAALVAEGIRYVHLRSLGNPRDNRAGFAHPHSPEAIAAHARFNEEVLHGAAGREGLRHLALMAAHDEVVVLCFEAEQSTCHRDLVISAVDESRERIPAQNSNPG